MHVAEAIAIGLFLVCVVTALRARRDGRAARAAAAPLLATGRRLYTRRTLLRLGGVIGAAALLVYSGADEAVDEHLREREARREPDDLERGLAREAKQFGEPWWVGVWVALTALDRFVGSTVVSRFGRRCAEATLCGLPILWTTQRVLGGSRPSDEAHGPRFVPFADENAASGHTFIAAVPWLVIARTARPDLVRTVAAALSPVTGWSRMHDRRHYLSQVVLGWWIAFEATGAAIAVEAIGEGDQGPSTSSDTTSPDSNTSPRASS